MENKPNDLPETSQKCLQSEKELDIRDKICNILLAIPDDEMYAKVLQVILEAVESPYGFFGYIDLNGDLVCPSMSRDVWDQCRVPHKDIFFSHEKWGGLWGRSLREQKIFCSNEPLSVPEGHIPIQRALCVPIIHRGTLIGLLAVGNKASNYTDKDQKLLKTMAQHIAPVLQARLQRDQQKKERRRLEKGRRRSERQLRESETKYEILVEQAKDAVAIIQDGVIKFINRAAVEITGYSLEELTGMPFLELIAPEERERIAHIHKLRMAGEKVPSAYETKLVRQDGTIRYSEFSIGLIQYHGHLASMVIARDITERKRTEEKLLKMQKLESLGVLAGGIAHDFNNLLAAIMGNLSMVEMDVRSGKNFYELLEAIEAIKTAAQQAKNLTQQLLTFAKGGAPVKEVASISKLLKQTISFALSGSQVRSELSIPDDLWWAKIDQGQISQVINNLIINADQAMPEGGTIMIRAENVILETQNALSLPEGKYVKISVKDRGVGILKEYLQKIFDPYFSTKSKGSGLGLAIAYTVIQKHNGYMSVESQVGAGTTFYIYLPAEEVKEIAAEKAVAVAGPCPGRGRILFMDDQQPIRVMMKKMLHYLGYEAEFAADGGEAIALYEKARETGQGFDAVILDLTVPTGMGGREAIQKLRKIDPKVKAIVSSGYSNTSIMSEYQKYGFCGVVAKPFEMKELSEALSKVIHGPGLKK